MAATGKTKRQALSVLSQTYSSLETAFGTDSLLNVRSNEENRTFAREN